MSLKDQTIKPAEQFTHPRTGLQYEAVKAEGCGGCAFDGDARLCSTSPRCYDHDTIFKEIPVNAIQSAVAGSTETLAPPAVRTDAALDLPPAGFVQSRQRAWDTYADGRAKGTGIRPVATVGMPRYDGFVAGFEAGFASRQPVIDALKLRSTTSPAPVRKAGKLRDLILASLRDEGPASAETLAKRLGRPLNSISPRFAHMLTDGVCHISGGEPAFNGKGDRNVYSYGPTL